MGGLGTPELILIFIALSYLGLITFSLIDAVRSTFKDSVTKLMWVLVILFFPFLGSILYLTIGRGQK
ncbi:PLDc_N domain-containing protein [Mucilaginibacter sp. 14171R-50]|uniref:PLD nuclease N-terminal domain-containing protein n=1 Tax=Mucilaginibacter sp. 14171R-50 TaxID=2703789 RepID=UPI00138B4D0B|nr:PLD nuclease N-terminal domain-containing protein [Mucilaginibacter sp. 14171R-50]QHS54634.1 PLDc_N domain-containing protein [Mucilaginibacter sp. 14171R-50]